MGRQQAITGDADKPFGTGFLNGSAKPEDRR
jgi:hypothetical protein